MFTNIFSKKSRSLLKSIVYSQSFSKGYMESIKNAPPEKPYPGFTPVNVPHSRDRVQIIQDPELKLKFLVEQPGFPGQTDIGIGIKLGSRDEVIQNSGSLSYLQQIMHSKSTFQETIQQYDFFQKSGCQLTMVYDPSSTYIRISFFPEDINQMTDIILDVALSQKNMYQQGVELIDDSDKIQDLVRNAAFKGQGIGIPKGGVGTVLNNQQFLKFQQKITPQNTLFSIAGYPNHNKLIELIKTKIKAKYSKFLSRKPFVRQPSRYHGGFYTFDHNPMFFECAIAYQSVPYNSEQFETFNVLRKIIGKAESFSSGGPGRGMYSRSHVNMLDRVACVLKADAINSFFDQTGLFGLTIGGPYRNSRSIVETCVKQLKLLRSGINPEQLQRAKNILLNQVYTNVQRQPERLQQLTKQVFFFGKPRIEQFEQRISRVTAKQIKEAITRIMDTPPTIVYYGNPDSIKSAPSQDIVRQLLKS